MRMLSTPLLARGTSAEGGGDNLELWKREMCSTPNYYFAAGPELSKNVTEPGLLERCIKAFAHKFSRLGG